MKTMASAMHNSSQWPLENSKHVLYHNSGDPLAIIYNEGLWRLNKVSPLYNIRYTPVKMKTYASKVKQAIIRTVQASSVKYDVLFEEIANLKYSEDDASGILITVSSTMENNSKTKVAYVAVFLSWGLYDSLDQAVHLPYMLERGEQRIGTATKATLQTLFDCNIKQFTFTQHQLLHFGFNFVDNDTSRSNDPFSIVYKTPQIDHKEKLNLTFEVGDIHMIWNGTKDETLKQSEMITLAYQILQNQIFHMLKLDITVFDVTEINMQKAEIKSNGTVKMKTPEIVNCVFTVLNEITRDNLHTADVSLDISE